eukprot:GEMP01016674.1.p1 GENE.GEMP01016674.1~~GEMP01016674.1.p1  ORF type:complete len:250 (+),score=30.92 GEMP01016674.1:21-770(+)
MALPLTIGDVDMAGLSKGLSIRQYMSRMKARSQMDLEFVTTQIPYLVFSPSKVYQLTSYRKQTKNQWARDDPGFIVIIVLALAISAFAYSLAFALETSRIRLFFRLLVLFIGLHFIAGGAVITTWCWFVCNRYLRKAELGSDKIEWQYGFDIHCNAFVPLFLLTHVIQYFLLPILICEGFLPSLLSNLLYIVATAYYCYITSLGYSKVPFIDKAEVFLYPVVVWVLLAIMCIFLKINPTRISIWFIFGD